MGIKYIHIPEQKKTVAILRDTSYDAYNKISKITNNTNGLFISGYKYLMNDIYRSVVVCSDEDEYSPEEGERQAKAKVLKRYYKDLDSKIDMFINDLNEAMFQTTVMLNLKKNHETT